MNLDKVDEEDHGEPDRRVMVRTASLSIKDIPQQDETKRDDILETQHEMPPVPPNRRRAVASLPARLHSDATAGIPPPPPPPEAPPTSSLPGRRGGPIQTKDLLLERKRLKKPEEIRKKVDVDRAAMFDKYKNYSHMPLVDSREYLRTLRSEIYSISFSGVEQLTDAFLFSLYQCKMNLDTVGWISLVGCYKVTDEGVYWITTVFKNMKRIQLTGCKVTEKSVHYLRTNLPQVTQIRLEGTDCGIIPVDCSMKLEGSEKRAKDNQTKPDIFVNGCPLISPLLSESESNTEGVASPYRKLVILTNDSLPWSPLAVLTSQKDVSPQKGFVFKQGWKPFQDHNITGVKSSAKVFNIFQVPESKGISEMVLSVGSIIVLPVHLHQNLSTEAAALKLSTDIGSILTKFDDCTFVVLGMRGETDKGDYSSIMDDIQQRMRANFNTWIERLQYRLRTSVDFNWRVAAMGFQEQEVLSSSQRLLRQAQLLVQDKTSTSGPTIVYTGITVGETSKLRAKDFQFLSEIVEADERAFGWNRMPLYSEKVIQYSANLGKSGLAIGSLTDLCKSQSMKELPMTGRYQKMAKVLSYATMWGHALYYPVEENQPIITDFNFLSTLLEKLFFQEAPRTCNICCLGDHIPCWKTSDLMEAGKGTSENNMKLFLRVLEKQGCLFKFPTDPWSTIRDVSYVNVLQKDFPENPPVPLEQFWPSTQNNYAQKEKYYLFNLGLPQSFFPNLQRHLAKLGNQTLLWKNGTLLQKGFLKILIQILRDSSGLPVILVQIRAPLSPSGGLELVEDSLWVTLKLYTLIVDHLVAKYRISVMKAVLCQSCAPSSDVKKILAEVSYKSFFHEHLVRAGDQREHCRACEKPANSKVQIGPVIDLTTLVPQHFQLMRTDSTKSDGSNPEDQVEGDEGVVSKQEGEKQGCLYMFNRCSMCDNCTIDGLNCSFNLKEGVQSRHCGCRQIAESCLHCGICKRCAMYIKRIVASIRPCFETPKSARYEQDEMIAQDELRLSFKGSIVGFLVENAGVSMTKSTLSPDFDPQMNLTLLQEGKLTVNVKFVLDDKMITYEPNIGSISVDGKEILPKDVNRVMDMGQTLSVVLSYVERGIDDMYVKLVLDGCEIFGIEMKLSRVVVSMTGVSAGVFVQVETPEKFRPAKIYAKRDKCCGLSVKYYPCAVEMSMMKIQKAAEDMCFGGRGLSLSGSACLALPQQMTMETLKYPQLESLDKRNYHFMCLTWNPILGKKSVDVKEPSQWQLTRLIHLIDSPGLPAENLPNLDKETSFMFWAWHKIFASYPEILLPNSVNHLFPQGLYTKETAVQVKEGLRNIVRQGVWRYYCATGFKALENMFQGHYRGKLITTKMQLISTAKITLNDALTAHISQTDVPNLNEVTSKFNANLTLYLCDSHAHCMSSTQYLTDIPTDLMEKYSVFISYLDLSNNELTAIPDAFFPSLPNLVVLNLYDNYLQEIPGSIKYSKKLHQLMLTENNLTDVPTELLELQQLHLLHLGNNRFTKVPAVITKLTWLVQLELSHMMLTELPEDFGNLENLKTLYLNGSCLSKLPKSFANLKNLEVLGLKGVPWFLAKSSSVVSFNQFRTFIHSSKIDRYLEANSEDKDELFRTFDDDSNGMLDIKELGKLNACIYNLFPRFGHKGKESPDESQPSGFPEEILQCTNLKMLHLMYQGFTKVPKEISNLTHLTNLNIAHNPNLLSLPAELSQIESLGKIDIDDCPNLKTPPREIREKGFHSVFAYLQRLMSGAVHSKRTKLMLVGLGGAGKTSLVQSLLSGKDKADLQHGEAITDGIDISTWTVEHDGNSITYNMWDFAGQTVYYNTHQFFLSTNRAIYLLLWNVRLGHEHAGLDFWLSSVSVQAPDAPIFVVGSHIDQVNKTQLPLEEMKQRYPQIAGFHFISNYTGEGIDKLREDILEVTLQQQYMGENIPAVWLTFEKNIELVKANTNIIDYAKIVSIANKSGIFDNSEIFQAVQFLHDLGSVQHFTNDYLKSKVVINPQWIVDVMACVVSVKNSEIQEGRLKHQDLATIWQNYPKSLHDWLLRLTEEFDLTFALNDEPVNLVPCLLPEKRPQFTWPEIEKGSDIRENKMVYKFDYLPAGLFNRGQVRLHNLSDSALIWKKGSFLRKNVHVALLQQTRKGELIVTVQGPRPENILFLVHEVFEGLIAESYNGVKYDFSMPCPECQKMFVKDYHMFDASTIRRALDMKAPFLQCIKYFHTISCTDLQTLLPPDNHSDFDVHLVQTVQGLKNLRKDLSIDIFISYCDLDGKLDNNVYIVPSKVHTDLVRKGYKCWFNEGSEISSMDEMAKALIDSSVFLAFVSMNYARNEECNNIFKYARLTLRKTIIVVAIGDGFEWKQSRLGILLADEVFINMTKPKLEYYNSKFDELLKSLSGKTRSVSEQTIAKPAVFISYTWVNSAEAVVLGTREIPGALGYGDPRKLKTYLEEHGINCWLDVERVGMNGLFDDIAEGLLSARLVIVCVSDEYAASPTCQIEFRYAANTLKLPIVIVVVGTGDRWRATEVGLMSVGFPIVNMQEKTRTAKKKLLSIVQKHLGQTDDVDGVEQQKAQKDTANEQHKTLSYQELFELAQRKLLRQLTLYAENQDLDVYPRLFMLDFATPEMEKNSKESQPEESEGYEESDREEKKDTGTEKIPVSRHTSNLLPGYKLERFCVYTLCEHEEGWHSVAEPILLPTDFGLTSLDQFSPYLSRMTAVMKYNKKLLLKCLTDEAGEDYISWLEKSPEATLSDYQTIYHTFREMVLNVDTNKTMGKLRRCHLTSGKTIWLCDSHRTSMRVTCLSSDDITPTKSKEHEKQLNDSMVDSLRTMDVQSVSGHFRCTGNAFRKIVPNRFSTQGCKQQTKKGNARSRHKKEKQKDSLPEGKGLNDSNTKVEEDKTVKSSQSKTGPDQISVHKPSAADEAGTQQKQKEVGNQSNQPAQNEMGHSQESLKKPGGVRQRQYAEKAQGGAPAEMPLPSRLQQQGLRHTLKSRDSQASLLGTPRGQGDQPTRSKSGKATSRACVLS